SLILTHQNILRSILYVNCASVPKASIYLSGNGSEMKIFVVY
ncbi:unnamed protein product, partial [Heterotrigona itama]